MDRLDALSDRDLRETFLFVRGRAAAPVTSAELARVLGIPRSVARWRLEKLAAAGLLETAFERRTKRTGPGAGRPAKTYAPAVETSPIEFPPRRYETLVALLSEALPRRKRKEALREIGVRYAQELAADMQLRPAPSIPAALKRVCRGLGRLGFHAAVSEVSHDSATLVSATCPLRPLVIENPEAAAIDAGMWFGLIASATATGARPRLTSCETHDCLEGGRGCRVRVDFRPARA
jgi:predicted ArsR family transcriptional regulator